MNAEDRARALQMVIKPEYTFDQRLQVFVETNKPPANLFEPLGWDRNPNPDESDRDKHYRRFFNKELEHVKEVMKQPSEFNQYKVMRG